MEVNFLNFFSPLFGSKMKQDKKVIFFFFLRGVGVSVGMHKSFMAKSAPFPPPPSLKLSAQLRENVDQEEVTQHSV